MPDLGGTAITNYQLEAIKGTIDGLSHTHIFGSASELPLTMTTMWPHDADHVFPTAATVMTLSSTDAADTSAGTGGQTIIVTGLLSDGTEATEIVSLNGITGVSTTNSYLRINDLEVDDVGTGEKNAGTIYIGTGTITAGEPAVVYGLIELGAGKAHSAIYSVPLGWDAYIMSYSANSSSNKSVEVELYTRYSGKSWISREHLNILATPTEHEFYSPLKYGPLSDITLRANGEAPADAIVSGSVDIILLKQGT